ncbi:MAG: hypothetical protein N4R02_00450 [Lactobacillus iners]|nr:hypothetical protein [Lactobacillus iners]
MPLEIKKNYANYVIENDQSVEILENKLATLLKNIRR